ncbi:type VI secretion system-associated FHA domain protein TagH [Aquipseudomonas guryensis]|uniref:Type VI secretion system-associated FHA domain protein TagH n=1 Tax=Aquipseudomonas guryensis TaxID=2759165 RepID=A0A7W4H3Q4_9GAMM|nr:type VI secretion system-associated FHA domain protein TagH [Pseudomonas guryensis]MBB1518547.1 type VI secretion system-associated FHA domain protein TagH [Pseudomonas guryensis]
MELVFDVVSAQQFAPGMLTSKSFKKAGGVIGRSEECDWSIPDSKRIISSRHAQVSYSDGHFYLTDTSSNGIQLKDSGASLRRGEPLRIGHGDVFCLGEVEIRARVLQDPAQFEEQIGQRQAAGSIIPDDAFLDLDPIAALEQRPRGYSSLDEFAGLVQEPEEQFERSQYARIDMESLLLPELVEAAVETPVEAEPIAVRVSEPSAQPRPTVASEPQSAAFWQRFGEALGVPLDDLDAAGREALALNAARLLKQSIGGLQQSLRTRGELKNELRLALTTVQSAGNNPLKHSADAGEALQALLRSNKPSQLTAEQSVGRAFRDLQAHQVALFAASRAAVKGLFDQFAPEQLTLRFEQERKPLLATAGSRWRAYQRQYRLLEQDDDWSQRLFARDFAKTYEEQVRLIATLNTDFQE